MGLFDWLSRQTDTKNRFTPTNFGDTKHYDGNAFNYGGSPGGAAAAAGQARQGQLNAQGQQAHYANQANQGFGAGMGGLAQSDAARAQQQQAAGLMMARATGQAPSIATMQADRQMQQAQAAQSSMAASARGPAGLALAQQNAAGNVAAAQQGISGQAQIAAAQERLAAEQAAMGAFSGIRGQDQSGANTAFGAGAQYGGLGMQAGQLGLGYAGLANQINTTQLGARMQQQGMLAGSHQQGQSIGAGVDAQNAGTNMTFVGGVAKAGEGGLSAIMGRAAGGPIEPGQPYLVGEQGPELVVPQQSGTVIPSGPTMGLLGMTTHAGAKAMSGPAAPDFGGKGGLMSGSPMGELKKHQAFGERFARNPMSYGGR